MLSQAIKNKNVSCFINVHLNGNVSNLKKIYKLCRKNNIKIIDDACHALGTKYRINKKNYNVCDNSFCDISTLSFHPTKIVTTGEGGAILTNNKNIYQKAIKLMNHGYEKSFIKKNGHKHEYYKIVSPGYNFRLSDLNCALGYSQLKNLKKKVSHRQKIAKFYNNYFRDSYFFDVLSINKNIESAYHLYPLQLKNIKKVNKIELINRLKKRKIFTQVHYLPLNRQPLYKNKNSKFPKSQIYFEKSFSIPIHDDIGIKDAKKIAKIINYECSKI